MKGKGIDADQAKEELGNRNTYHSDQAQKLIKDASLFQGADHAEKDAENGRKNQGCHCQLNGSRKVVFHQSSHRHAALDGVAEFPVPQPDQPFKIAYQEGLVEHQ